jgi:molecular chaperone GrpE
MTNDNDNKKPEEEAVAEDAKVNAQDSAEDGAPEAAAETDADPSIEELLIKAYEELAEMKDKLLRAMAETENIRRRSVREKEDAAKYGITGFARDMVPVADNLGRAVDALPENAREDERFKSFIEGVELTSKDLATAFEKHGISEIRPEGDKFDHNLHQAMFEIEDPTTAPGTILQVMQIGYTIGERLLRPAMVGVSKAPAKPAEPETTED